ncbi:MAG TPA: hypothetical protein VII92_14815 [Anaerolineae bacterium]
MTWPATAPVADTPVKLATTGTLPTGLVAGTIYYCKSPSGSTSNLSATPGGAAIDTSGSQSGVHTIGAPYRIYYDSKLRYDVSLAFQQYTRLVNYLDTAALFGVPFAWDTGTSDADPGAGKLRANNASLASATLLYISKTSRADANVATFLASLDDSTNPSSKGVLILGAQPNGEQAIFTVGAVTDATGYIKLAISGASGVTAFLAGDLINFQFIRAGDNAPFVNDNMAVNGAVDISQELGTTGATLANNTAKYIADCWEAMYNHGAATAVVTSAQLAAASFPSALAGFSFGHQIKATTAISSPANGDFAKHSSKIEGYRIARLGWGAADAAAIVVAFSLYSTASGTAFVKLSNFNQSRCYYHEITIAAGWNFFAFNVAGDTSGTWQATTSTGLTVEVFAAGKAATPASSLDAWGSTNTTQTTNSTNLLANNNNQTIMTGLFVASGTQLPMAANLPLLMRPFDDEMTLAYRYYQKTYNYSSVPGSNEGGTNMLVLEAYNASMAAGFIIFKGNKMRAAPSITLYSQAGLSGKINRFLDGVEIGTTVTVPEVSAQGFRYISDSGAGLTSGVAYQFHYVAAAGL